MFMIPSISQFQQIRNLIQFSQRPIQILPSMSRRNTESSTGHENGNGGKSDHHNRETTFQTLP
ncbi:hypothetical protein HJC23_000499 [Cyclotella cryptica]|uniref:Uncharacterized protein n=1 Tax=Cyclotella cryptica TaxID=29204 RepID=A0ABD3NUA8_9STRA